MAAHPAYTWFYSLSMTDQEYYRKNHPFFGKMSRTYFWMHTTSIIQLYEYFKPQISKL